MSCNTPDGHYSPGDTAFMVVATTFVMIQTPAMGLAQAGLVREKNTLSVLFQTIVGMAVGSLTWLCVGFSLTFGPSTWGLIGDPSWAPMLAGLPLEDCMKGQTIPVFMFVAFQMMFALMTPVILTGAWAEKMTFPGFMWMMLVWPFFVYYPLAHWLWHPDGWLNKLGALDFAGGTVIHLSTGLAALILSLYMEKRKNAAQLGTPYHNLPLFMLGGCLIWAGWYSFNSGSALAANAQAARAVLNTHISASTGGIVGLLLSYWTNRRYSLIDFMNGVFASLAAITAGSGYVMPWHSVLIGAAGALMSYYVASFLKNRLKIDDVLDVFSLQGVPGLLGSLALALFAPGSNFVHQLVSVSCCIVWTTCCTVAIVVVGNKLVGFNVSAEEERHGLDRAQMGEFAYGASSETKVLSAQEMEYNAVLLCDKAAKGDIEGMRRVLQLGGSAAAGAADYDKRTPLHIAASRGQLAVVQLLVEEYHVNIDAADRWGSTPYRDAVLFHQTAIEQYLREHGARMEQRELDEELFHRLNDDDLPGISALLDAGANVNAQDYDGRTLLHVARDSTKVALEQLLLSRGARDDLADRWGNLPGKSNAKYAVTKHGSPRQRAPSGSAAYELKIGGQEVLDAVSNRDLPELKRLAKKGEDLRVTDYDGRGLLHVAVCNGDFPMVKYLLSTKRLDVNAADVGGRTPLHEAVANNFHEIGELLRRKGAVVRDSRQAFQLCKQSFEGNLHYLVQAQTLGIDLSTQDYDGRTALHLAACAGNRGIVEWLLNAGADPTKRDAWGHLPMDDAESNGHPFLAFLLRPDRPEAEESDTPNEAPTPGLRPTESSHQPKAPLLSVN